MRALIDTHVLIWWAKTADRLPQRVLDILQDQQSDLILSLASCWEMALKADRLGIVEDFQTLIDRAVRILRLSIMNVEMKHVAISARLPFHHRDPFDRMLVAQAISEGVPIISVDKYLARYDVPVIW